MSGTSAGAKRGWATRRAIYGPSGGRGKHYKGELTKLDQSPFTRSHGGRTRFMRDVPAVEERQRMPARISGKAHKRGSGKTEREMIVKAFDIGAHIGGKPRKRKK